MKNLNIFGFHWKIRLFWGWVWGVGRGVHETGADCLKKWDAWTVCKFKGGLGKKEGVVFEGGWYPNADYVLGGYVLKG